MIELLSGLVGGNKEEGQIDAMPPFVRGDKHLSRETAKWFPRRRRQIQIPNDRPKYVRELAQTAVRLREPESAFLARLRRGLDARRPPWR